MMVDVARRTLDRILEQMPGDVARGADLVALQDHVVHRGFALASCSDGRDAWKVLILDGFGGKDDRVRLDRLLRLALKPEAAREQPTSRDLRGRKVFAFQGESDATWWQKGDALILVQGPVDEPLARLLTDPQAAKPDFDFIHRANVEAVFKAIDGKIANASANPDVVAAQAEGRDLDGFEPTGLFAASWQSDEGVLESMSPKNHQAITDLFDSAGPAWSAYAEPVAIMAEIRKEAETEAKLDAAAARLNTYFLEQELGEGVEAKPGDPPPALVLERLPAADRGHRLTSPGDRVPWLSDVVQPTILIDGTSLVCAANPASARAAAAKGALTLSGEEAKLVDCLPSNLALLSICDPRDSFWPERIADFRSSTTLFFGYLEGVDPQLTPSDVLTKLGVRPPSPTAPTENLKADAIRASLFPSVLAATIDDHSVRFVSLEALPLGCISLSIKGEADGKITIKAATKP